MKKILITGANSYIGTSFEKYIKENYPEQYEIDTVDMIDGSWREKSFSGYNSVFHVAGIAHQKETKENAHLYYEINRDLAIETAKKAKTDGVPQFIFLSSMSVYGMDVGTITKDTEPSPKSNYGKSKLQAEEGILQLAEEHFKVCVLRPPMVYGNGCRGNFNFIVKFALRSPVFPKTSNKRSMIYIDNLCSFVEVLADRELFGVFFPQNRDYVRTDDMVKRSAAAIGRNVHLSPLLGSLVRLAMPFSGRIKKAFGTLIYEDMSCDLTYKTVDFEDSIKLSMGDASA